MTEKHPDCIYPLCGCAGTANCKADPLNTPLPCDVKVGATTFRKGVKLSTFVTAAQHWHREAFPEFYTLTDEQKAANLAALQGNAGVKTGAAAQLSPPTAADEWRAPPGVETSRRDQIAAACGEVFGWDKKDAAGGVLAAGAIGVPESASQSLGEQTPMPGKSRLSALGEE